MLWKKTTTPFLLLMKTDYSYHQLSSSNIQLLFFIDQLSFYLMAVISRDFSSFYMLKIKPDFKFPLLAAAIELLLISFYYLFTLQGFVCNSSWNVVQCSVRVWMRECSSVMHLRDYSTQTNALSAGGAVHLHQTLTLDALASDDMPESCSVREMGIAVIGLSLS